MNLINIDEPNKKSFTSKCLGIDFGTTNSVCSIKIGEKVIFIEDSKKMNLIPSIVCFDKTVKVGNDIDLEKNLCTSTSEGSERFVILDISAITSLSMMYILKDSAV